MASLPLSRTLLLEVLQRLPEAILIVDEAGVIRFANRAASRFYEQDESALRALTVVRLLPDWFSLPATCREFPTRAVVAGGGECPITLSLAPVEKNNLVIIVAVLRDSSQALKNTERSRLQESNLRALVRERDLDIANMNTELGEAAKILNNHLPASAIEGLNVSWVFEPCHTLGGDMLLLHRHQDHVIVGALDVAGHGVAASLLAIGLSRSLSPERERGSCLFGRDGVLRKPMDIVTRLNQESHTLFESGLFVTLLFGVLDLRSGEGCFTCAGHPLPITLSRGKARQVRGVVDPPLGLDRQTTYRQFRLALKPQEILIIFTDGVTECRSPSGEFFGEERLIELLSRNAHRGSGLSSEVSARLERFREGATASDDMSLLALQIA